MRAATVVFAASAVIGTLSGAAAQIRSPAAELEPTIEAVSVRPGSDVQVALSVRLPAGVHVQSDTPRDPALIPTRLTIDEPAGVRVREILYPVAADLEQVGLEQPLSVFGSEFVIRVRLAIAETVEAGDVILQGRLRYQPCDERVCFAPRTAEVRWILPIGPGAPRVSPPDAAAPGPAVGSRSTGPGEPAEPAPGPPVVSSRGEEGGLERLERFQVLATTGGYLNSADFLRFIGDAERGVAPRGLFEGRGPLAVLLIVFIGGLALNLTPCVLPMIPINMAIIGAGAQAGSRRRGFLLGSTYGGAMALVYGILGLVVILTAGTFGTINASPWFNLAVAAVFVVLGLAMFDVIPIDFSSFSSGLRGPTRRGTFAVAFSMGAVAALLAGACVAPVVIQVVLFSSSLYAGGTTLALALPFCLGIGMALPWPFAGAGLATLPKPGPWMVRVKQALGLLILATAIYYGHLAYTLFDDRSADPLAVSSSVQAKLDEGWFDSLPDGLALAERTGKPVLLDFWATWCKNCLTMDATTFADAEVVSALSEYVKIKVQAEDPDAEPVKSLLTRFNAIGLPTYVVLRPDGAAVAGTAGPAPAVSGERE